MFELIIIPHAKITEVFLNEVIRIKSSAWPYPYKKQVDWINNNLNKSDAHLLLRKNYEPVAYLNLIDIDVIIDKKNHKASGVGNVCAVEKGKGYGNELMRKTNEYIKERKKTGLLFCKQNLVEFYKKQNWKLIEKNQLELSFDNSIIETMIYNYTLPFNKLIYSGQTF